MPLKTLVDEQPSMNLTSMIDVVLLLLIFFMISTEFRDSEWQIELKVPRVANASALTAAPEKKVVNVYSDGQITLDRSPVTLKQLADRLAAAKREYADLGVMVRGDAASTFQNVADVLNACKQAGIAELAISVKLANTK